MSLLVNVDQRNDDADCTKLLKISKGTLILGFWMK